MVQNADADVPKGLGDLVRGVDVLLGEITLLSGVRFRRPFCCWEHLAKAIKNTGRLLMRYNAANRVQPEMQYAGSGSESAIENDLRRMTLAEISRSPPASTEYWWPTLGLIL